MLSLTHVRSSIPILLARPVSISSILQNSYLIIAFLGAFPAHVNNSPEDHVAKLPGRTTFASSSTRSDTPKYPSDDDAIRNPIPAFRVIVLDQLAVLMERAPNAFLLPPKFQNY
jgi:hypothetical protein